MNYTLASPTYSIILWFPDNCRDTEIVMSWGHGKSNCFSSINS